MAIRQDLLRRYRYDALDRLMDTTDLTQASLRRFYQKTHLTTEIQGEVQHSIMQYQQQLLAWHQHCSGSSETSLLATDLHRSVLTTKEVRPLRSAAYTPYGYRPPLAGSPETLGFNGERPDPVTGHYLLGNGHRAYNPALMRFNSPDGLSPFGKGGLNAYAYCGGDPVNQVDPGGQFSLAPVKSAFEWAFEGFFASPVARVLYGPKTTNITNFRTIAEEVEVFDDIYKGGPRLNIMAHGNFPEGHITPYMASGEEVLCPRKLLSMLNQNGIHTDEYTNIRLISCTLADAEFPFAAVVSNQTQKPVKAFSGNVAAFAYPPGQKIAYGAIDESVNRVVIFKNGGVLGFFTHYRPKKFLPVPNTIRTT
jgi:RHS repeat-associated protein